MEKGTILKEPDLLEQTYLFYGSAAEKTSLKKEYMDFIKKSSSVLSFKLPLKRDNGEFEILEAYRVHHSCHTRPCKGGIRMSADLNARMVEAFALINTIKMGLCDIPFGGSFGGIKCDPKKYSQSELERIIRRYTLELSQRGFIGPAVDVPEPDLHVTSAMMNWMKDTYQILYGNRDINAAGVCTGKSSSQGGIDGRNGAWGKGVCRGAEAFLNLPYFSERYNIKPGLSGKSVIFQGFGKIGYWTAKHFSDAGAKIIGVVSRDSAVYDEAGINVEEISKYYREKKTFKGYNEGKNSYGEDKSEEFLYKPCDILVQASVEGGININNVDKFHAKIIVEAINGATTYLAQKILDSKGVVVIPDLILNIGWTVYSYFEWLKNIEHAKLGRLLKGWEKSTKEAILSLMGKKPEKAADVEGGSEEDIVSAALVGVFKETMKEVAKVAQEKDVSTRTAAYMIGLERINAMYKEAGFVI